MLNINYAGKTKEKTNYKQTKVIEAHVATRKENPTQKW